MRDPQCFQVIDLANDEDQTAGEIVVDDPRAP